MPYNSGWIAYLFTTLIEADRMLATGILTHVTGTPRDPNSIVDAGEL